MSDYIGVSLFSGAMGLDIGLEQAGVDIRVCQDFDKACYNTMIANGKNAMTGDIKEISSDDILSKAGVNKEDVFLLCGGPPCQPFSTAGRRGGVNDPRGSLFMDYMRILRDIKPRFAVFENVKGLLSTKHDGRPVIDIILDEFHNAGYKTVHGLLDAVHYGVPQFRERVIVIASRDNEDIFLPMPTHFMVHQNIDYRWSTLRSVISDLENTPGDYVPFSADRLRYLQMVPEGGNWRDLPPEIQPVAMGGAWESGGGKVGFYRRLSYSQPSPTVVTSPVQKATMMCHPTQDRPLSVKEYARIQQFPDDWVVTGTITERYRQIGNAVPVGLARAIGSAIIATAEGTAVVKTKRTRGTSVHKLQDKAV